MTPAQFVAPPVLEEGVTLAEEGPLSRLFGSGRDFPLERYELDLNDPAPFSEQIWNQVGPSRQQGGGGGMCS